MIIDIIATSEDDVIKINKINKATRIELCSDLKSGGLTPDLPLIKKCCDITKIPIRVMVRNNDGYTINEKEKEQIRKQIKFINKTKADGIVIGWCNKDNSLDWKFIKEIREMASHKKCTLHRAFDQDLDNVLDNCVKTYENNIDTILTSGGPKNKVYENLDNVRKFIKLFKGDILLGNGVNLDNCKELRSMGFNNIHIGSAVRINNSWSDPIDTKLIEKI